MNIYLEISKERERQERKWGEQNHPILEPSLLDRDPQRMCEKYEIPTECRARQKVEMNAKRGDLTYMHILIEEVSEAASCGRDTSKLRQEMVQCAAVCVAIIECIDRNYKPNEIHT